MNFIMRLIRFFKDIIKSKFTLKKLKKAFSYDKRAKNVPLEPKNKTKQNNKKLDNIIQNKNNFKFKSSS